MLKALGRGTGLIMSRLAVLEKQQLEAREEMGRVEQELDLATIKRPTAEQVAEVWGQVGELWGELTEEERSELLGGLVKEVQVTEKNRVLLKLSPVAEVHGDWFAIKSQTGAGTYPDYKHGEKICLRFLAPKAGSAGHSSPASVYNVPPFKQKSPSLL